MKSTARIHHYLTQGYLGTFTDMGTVRGKLHVVDTRSGRCFLALPKRVAAERDFNRVDMEGRPSDVLEQALAPFEDMAVQTCRGVNQAQTFPNDEDCNYILNLLCLFAVRNPQLRGQFNRSLEMTYDAISNALVSDEKTWKYQMKKAQEAGFVKQNNVSFEEMKRFIEERRYTYKFEPAGNLRVEFDAFDTLLPLLGERTWSLLVVPDSIPGFICSDHPVVLTRKGSGGPRNIGYGSKNTEVFFPLGPRTGLLGVYEEPLRTVVTMTPDNVAALNTRQMESADRHVYSQNGGS